MMVRRIISGTCINKLLNNSFESAQFGKVVTGSSPG